MTDTQTTQTNPSVAVLIEAFAQALLPLAGPYGVIASDVVSAGEQFLEQFRGAGSKVYTMADLEQIATQTTADLSQLQSIDNAQQVAQAKASTQQAAIQAEDAAAAKPVGLPADKMTPVVGAGNATS